MPEMVANDISIAIVSGMLNLLTHSRWSPKYRGQATSPVNVRSKMTELRTKCNILNFYSKTFRKHLGIPKIFYKNISGGTFSKHPLKLTSHLTHVDISDYVLFSCKMILFLYLSNCLLLYNVSSHPISRALY